MVATRSRGSATSSTMTPSCAGRSLSGGSYSGTIAPRAGPRSRPRVHHVHHTPNSPATSTTAASPTATGEVEKYSRKPRGRSTSIGAAATPVASAATMVSCSSGENGRVATNAARGPSVDDRHGSVDPVGPSKHATFFRVTGESGITLALTASAGTPQLAPFTFQ